MKKIYLIISMLTLLGMLTLASAVFSQSVGIGSSTFTPDASSILEIRETTKGLLIPRMTQAQRNAVASPATSLLIFQTDNTPGYYYYNGSSWTRISGSWLTGGNSNGSMMRIGTNDNFDLPFYTNNTEKMRITSQGCLFINTAATSVTSKKLWVTNSGAGAGGTGGGYSSSQIGCAILGIGGNVTYGFGIAGYCANQFARTGGVLGVTNSPTIWGSLGYYDASGNAFAGYFNGDMNVTGNINADGAINVSSLSGYTIDGTATNGQFLRGNGTSFVSGAIQISDLPVAIPGLNNPGASIGLSPVNGIASTALRSDAAPALSQAIVPTWTGVHSFTNGTYSALFTGGNVGIGTATPSSKLALNGSFATAINKQTNNYPLTANDYTVIFNGTSLIATLPAATTCTGRIYVVVNQHSSNLSISSYQNLSDALTTSVNPGTSITLQSDGINWYQIR